MWYFLVGLAALFIFFGLDDLFIDGYYWIRCIWRFWKTRHYEPLTYEKLIAKEEQLIAVLVPCWREANIIATMLRHNCYSIDYNNYYFFVGVYPNDPETVAEVRSVADINDRVQCIVGDTPGPTNKAANLNIIYKYIKTFEKTHQKHFNIFVFHDSEDIIHPLSFKLYNYLIPRKDMIQIPIFPLEVRYRNFTHWLYADEFAENHTKDIIVRESLRAHVPSAGVGTAFYRNALEMLENPETGTPFSTSSLTEDYRTSLAIRMLQLKQVFVTQYITRTKWKKKWIFSKRYIQKQTKEFVAVRALFPMEYKKAVRQKARWIIGIVFQEWRDGEWPKEWRVRYTLAHDRKSFITHFINGLGYLLFMYWLIYSIITYAIPEYPSLQERFNLYPWVWWLSSVATFIMCERLLQRTIATYRIYGFIPACFVIPRAFYGNILNLHALIRAYQIYFTTPKNKKAAKQPAWDKTEHHFPGRHLLVPYRKRLGDLLLEKGLINDEQLRSAIFEQHKTGERLGEILCRLNFISSRELQRILALQYNLSLFPHDKLPLAQEHCLPQLPKRTRSWMKKRDINPIKFDQISKDLIIAIHDPTNELLLKKIIKHLKPYKIEFVLIDV
jgi:adsorption protein B